MTREIRRIERPATPDEKNRHEKIRAEIEAELPELKQWARDAANRQTDRTPVGTILGADESDVLKAIDEYAAKHSLVNRSAVVREALSRLLGVELARR